MQLAFSSGTTRKTGCKRIALSIPFQWRSGEKAFAKTVIGSSAKRETGQAVSKVCNAERNPRHQDNLIGSGARNETQKD
jgi:hypothetical protein